MQARTLLQCLCTERQELLCLTNGCVECRCAGIADRTRHACRECGDSMTKKGTSPLARAIVSIYMQPYKLHWSIICCEDPISSARIYRC